MVNRRIKITAAVTVLLIAFPGVIRADRAELEKKLEQELAIDLNDVTIEAALREIGGEAGLRIDLSKEAIWKLPDGAETRLSVKLEGQLGKSLEQMLNSFFMRYAVGSQTLTVYPRPELQHIIGRPTAGELGLLTSMYANKMWLSTSGPALPESYVQKILNGMAKEPLTIMPPDELRTVAAVMQMMSTRASSSSSGAVHDPNSAKGTPVTIATLLEGLSQSSNRRETWYIRGPAFPRQVAELWIVSKEEFWKAHLDQVIDVSFDNEKGETIVRELARWTDMDLTVSYPLIEELNNEITLEVQNVKLREALEKVLSILGIAWRCNISEGTIELNGSERPPQRSARTASSQSNVDSSLPGGYVGKISIPMEGGKYFIEFMLREGDLTEELRQLRQAKIREILEQLSKAAGDL